MHFLDMERERYGQIKWAWVIAEVRKVQVKIICIQETHMVKDRLDQRKKPWIQCSYHSCHTIFYRGVTLMVHKTVARECNRVKRDPDWRYVFVFARLHSLPFVIMGK